MESKLTELKDPFIYFIRATYIPFANMTRTSFDFDPGVGTAAIYVNDSEQGERHSVALLEPPTMLKFVMCQESCLHYHYPFIQVSLSVLYKTGTLLMSGSSKSITSGFPLFHLIASLFERLWSKMLWGCGWGRLTSLYRRTLARWCLSIRIYMRPKLFLSQIHW